MLYSLPFSEQNAIVHPRKMIGEDFIATQTFYIQKKKHELELSENERFLDGTFSNLNTQVYRGKIIKYNFNYSIIKTNEIVFK